MHVHHGFYISTGRLDAMYTLRHSRSGGMFFTDSYICNLAATPEKAEAKARDYFDRVGPRFEGPDVTVSFCGYADDKMGQRRGKLSILDTRALVEIERGLFPFGKHKGTAIADAPDGYVIYWADQAAADPSPVVAALASACMGVALDRDLIAKREAVRADRAAQDARSTFLGEVGQRLDLPVTLTVAVLLNRENIAFEAPRYLNKLHAGDDVIIYFGKKLGEPGDELAMRATVKAHSERDGVKQTVVSRPKVA